MDVSTILNNSQTNVDQSKLYESAQKSLGQEDFMTLLVTQLKNQDPFEPVDNAQFVSQLAQFSALEQAKSTNTKMDNLAQLQEQAAQLTGLAQGSSLIGKQVSYYNPEDETVYTGLVEALENLEDGVVLKIGEHLVPLTNVMEITTAPVVAPE